MNEIETIFCDLLKCERSRLYLDTKGLVLDSGQFHRLQRILKKRVSGEPLQYLIGDADFMGLRLKVRPGVFIPRPETEVVVETVLKYAASREPRATGLKILDIGTGSGCIAIALAKFIEKCQVTAIDISRDAIMIAKHNAVLNGVKAKMDIIHRDFSNLDLLSSNFDSFDFIVSNPPYVAPQDYEELPQDVRYEPPQALFAAEDGLSFYIRIEQFGRKALGPGGFIFLELGDGQAQGLQRIFSDRALWRRVAFKRDNNGKERVAVIEKSS